MHFLLRMQMQRHVRFRRSTGHGSPCSSTRPNYVAGAENVVDQIATHRRAGLETAFGLQYFTQLGSGSGSQHEQKIRKGVLNLDDADRRAPGPRAADDARADRARRAAPRARRHARDQPARARDHRTRRAARAAGAHGARLWALISGKLVGEIADAERFATEAGWV